MKREVIIRYTLEEGESETIREYMRKNRISMRDLAKTLGCSAAYVCDMVNGKRRISDPFHKWIAKNVYKDEPFYNLKFLLE